MSFGHSPTQPHSSRKAAPSRDPSSRASVHQVTPPPWRPERDFSARERRSALSAPETPRFHRSTATFSLWATSERRSAPKSQKCTLALSGLRNRPIRRRILTFPQSDFGKMFLQHISKNRQLSQSAFETVNIMVSGRLFRPTRESSLKSHFSHFFTQNRPSRFGLIFIDVFGKPVTSRRRDIIER